MKIYESTKQGKTEFVREVLSPLVYQADTGWFGAEYVHDKTTMMEYVHLLTQTGIRGKTINVSMNSLEAIVRDVFRNL